MKRTVVLASAADEVALRLPRQLTRPDVVVITPRDLSRAGWCYRPGAGRSTIVAGSEILESEQLVAVVTRLPWVSERELSHIVAGDRAYVAAEMGAFLTAWLTDLPCPVANRPSPSCLFGPFWRHERWIREAARAGLTVEPARRVVSARGAESPQLLRHSQISVTVVGKTCFGAADELLIAQAQRLAEATGVETLRINFTHNGPDARFITASPWPHLENDAVATALLDHLAELPTHGLISR